MNWWKMVKYLLLDANIVIIAYEMGIWTALTQVAQIALPASVIEESDTHFSYSNTGIPKELQVKDLAVNGEIESIEAESNEFLELTKTLDDSIINGLDPGEAEALALIHCDRVKEYSFCTSDILAIKALALLGKSEMGISFEKALKNSGMKKNVKYQFSEKFFKHHLNNGIQDMITELGLRKG